MLGWPECCRTKAAPVLLATASWCHVQRTYANDADADDHAAYYEYRVLQVGMMNDS